MFSGHGRSPLVCDHHQWQAMWAAAWHPCEPHLQLGWTQPGLLVTALDIKRAVKLLPMYGNTNFVCPLLHKAIYKHRDTFPRDVALVTSHDTARCVWWSERGSRSLFGSHSRLTLSQLNNFIFVIVYSKSRMGLSHSRGNGRTYFSCFATYKSKRKFKSLFCPWVSHLENRLLVQTVQWMRDM